MKRDMLFLGGPLHAEVIGVETGTPIEPGGETLPPSYTDLESASVYTRRKVAHQADATGQAWTLSVMVHESIQDPGTAQAHLGDAIVHRYFVLYGSPVETQEQQPANGKHHGLIIPGR